ncbi:hypothetical protein U0070_010929 [Myodes glareolus]|uniref:Uncharacterized protein n=1 Tax=Myodes glareolus TaxID=447135 RepID=A0AAW0I097_MYOGA
MEQVIMLEIKNVLGVSVVTDSTVLCTVTVTLIPSCLLLHSTQHRPPRRIAFTPALVFLGLLETHRCESRTSKISCIPCQPETLLESLQLRASRCSSTRCPGLCGAERDSWHREMAKPQNSSARNRIHVQCPRFPLSSRDTEVTRQSAAQLNPLSHYH